MLSNKSFSLAAMLLLVVPMITLSFKSIYHDTSMEDLIPRDVYEVVLELDAANIPNGSFIKSYLPLTNQRQRVINQPSYGDSLEMEEVLDATGKRITWRLDNQKSLNYRYVYKVEVKALKFNIPKNSPFEYYFEDSINVYRLSEPFIQSSHPLIDSLAQELKSNTVLGEPEGKF